MLEYPMFSGSGGAISTWYPHVLGDDPTWYCTSARRGHNKDSLFQMAPLRKIGKDKNHYQSELNCTLETYSKHPSASDVLMLIVSILHRTNISDSHLRVPLQARMTIAMGRCQTWNGAQNSAHTRKQPCEIPLIMQWKSLSSWENH